MPKSKQTKTKRKQSAPKNDEALMLACVAQVPFDGWSLAALTSGAQRYGVDEAALKTTFPRGVKDLVVAFSSWANDGMLAQIGKEKLFVKMRTRDKVAFAVRARLEVLTPHREAMRQLALWYALPHHAPEALRNLGKLTDSIWQAAGDTSTDFNFYTKRALLGGVIKGTTLYWLQDDSPGQTATWGFLDRRIAEVLRVGKAASRLRDLPEHFGKLKTFGDIIARFRRTA